MFDHPAFDGHERVVALNDAATGLRAFVAIHSTALGPAGGGCRLWHYEDAGAALGDALRLSRGMSYKNALAGVPMGGGKAVILGPVPDERRADVFTAFGRAVDALNGRYVTAEDVGVAPADLAHVATVTRYVSGIVAREGVGGNPAPFTARGVCIGLEAAARFAFGRRDLEGLRVAIQGLGGVGMNLAAALHARGARLVVADLATARRDEACDRFAATPAALDEILLADVDILAPCALGGVLTEDIARRMRAGVIAGGANNQIADAAAERALFERGITYAPDYVVNAGGIILVSAEYTRDGDLAAVDARIEAIGPRTRRILEAARTTGTPSGTVADEMARAALAGARVAA
ncbi:Glu/Leu/Phe/Val dehydrogenase [Acuticoccus sp. I52.16.1]|uniref:Glu/Leu/Phe/Val family dehydrogenase n=1 Tax=Acuticoccus sp. I52.16.1 TaxID=2928472 RepID=UPI001FD50847|nr:Glu/Leu/Phe/Val dehydrogenase dimerization domain-containing protein [Acuticoccus sp. I52.16.1]UOM37242.1 amino acid dehydrogenase [Acuticoccus sp. I52.16.1]